MKYKNNPANIRYSKNNRWLGLSGSVNGFCEFDTLEHGLRALVLILCKYIYVYKLTSVKGIISRFAPSTENDTSNYIRFVSDFLRDRGINPDSLSLQLGDIELLVSAICRMESGFKVQVSSVYVMNAFFSYVKSKNIKLV